MSNTHRTYTLVSDPTWELIRAAYLSGLSGAVVARRFGVTLSSLRKRASRHGWTKQALARATGAKPAAVEVPPPPPSLHPDSLVKSALTGAAQAVAEGRPWAARAFASTGEAMARLAERYPRFHEAESVSQSDERHAYWMAAIQDLAVDLACRLVRGEPISEQHAAAVAAWRESTGRELPLVPLRVEEESW